MKSKQVSYLYIFAALALAACSTTAPVKKDDATVVQQRAVERWNLLIAHKADKAYDYLSPGYRSTETREDYVKAKNLSQIHWQSVTPIDQKCDADTCTVRVMITSKVALPQLQGHEVETQAPLTERWLKSDGQWYFLPDDVQKATKKQS